MRQKRVFASKPVACKVPAWHRSRNLVSDTGLNFRCNYQLSESVIALLFSRNLQFVKTVSSSLIILSLSIFIRKRLKTFHY